MIPPGSVAIDGIYLSPTGQLPPPGTQVDFTATSATNSAITASQALSFTVPAIQAPTLSLSPATFSTTSGTAVIQHAHTSIDEKCSGHRAVRTFAICIVGCGSIVDATPDDYA